MEDKIYFLTEGSYIKIGYTTQSINKRIQQLNTGSIKKIYLLGWIEGDKKVERELHKRFSNSRVRMNGEWFAPTPDLIQFINDNNLEPNCTVDVIDNQVMRLLSLKII